MPSLASCYFCGDAVDASLDDYAVPPDAPAEAQVTVTLCAGCKSKLDELLESIEPAVEPTRDDATPAEPVAGDPEPVFADEPADQGTDPEPAQAGDGGVTPGDASPETALDEASGGDDAVEPASEPEPPDPGFEDGISFDEQPTPESAGRPAEGSAGPDGESPPAPGSGPDPAGGDLDPDATPPADGSASDVPEQADPGPSDPEPAPGADPGGADGPDRSGSVEQSRTGSPEGSSGPLADVSTRTYNRVVRLLQNREFPVDRAEFELLASNAYELDQADVGVALDATIQKGLLDERDGMLRRPE